MKSLILLTPGVAAVNLPAERIIRRAISAGGSAYGYCDDTNLAAPTFRSLDTPTSLSLLPETWHVVDAAARYPEYYYQESGGSKFKILGPGYTEALTSQCTADVLKDNPLGGFKCASQQCVAQSYNTPGQYKNKYQCTRACGASETPSDPSAGLKNWYCDDTDLSNPTAREITDSSFQQGQTFITIGANKFKVLGSMQYDYQAQKSCVAGLGGYSCNADQKQCTAHSYNTAVPDDSPYSIPTNRYPAKALEACQSQCGVGPCYKQEFQGKYRFLTLSGCVGIPREYELSTDHPDKAACIQACTADKTCDSTGRALASKVPQLTSKPLTTPTWLYQGAVPDCAMGKTGWAQGQSRVELNKRYIKYQQDMIKFAIAKGISRIFIDISSPSINHGQTVDNLAKVLAMVPDWMEVGALLEVNTHEAFHDDDYLEAGKVPGGMLPFKDTWLTPQIDFTKYKSCGDYIQNSPMVASADAYCKSQSNNTESYCRVDGTSTKGGVCHLYPNIECDVPSQPPGCPNSIQAGMKWMAHVNEVAKSEYGAKSVIQHVSFDKENSGEYSSYVNLAMEAAKHLQTENGGKPSFVSIGFAGQYSLDPSALYSSSLGANFKTGCGLWIDKTSKLQEKLAQKLADANGASQQQNFGGSCTKYTTFDGNKFCTEWTLTSSNPNYATLNAAQATSTTCEGNPLCFSCPQMPNHQVLKDTYNLQVFSLPEFYWYGELKPNGCTGCTKDITNDNLLSYRTRTDMLASDVWKSNCNNCKDRHSTTGVYPTEKTWNSADMLQKCSKVHPTDSNKKCSLNGQECRDLKDCGTCYSNFAAGTKCTDAELSSWTQQGDLSAVLAGPGDGAGCTKMCWAGYGCMSCGYDANGQFPNPEVLYTKCLNDPQCLIDAWNGKFNGQTDWEAGVGIEKVIRKALQGPGKSEDNAGPTVDNMMVPMLSLEIAHDIGFGGKSGELCDGGKCYAVSSSGENPDLTCATREFAGKTCGTFDGFAFWSWNELVSLINKYTTMPLTSASSSSLANFAIYEWQFVPPHFLFDSDQVECPSEQTKASGPCKCTGNKASPVMQAISEPTATATAVENAMATATQNTTAVDNIVSKSTTIQQAYEHGVTDGEAKTKAYLDGVKAGVKKALGGGDSATAQ